MSRLSVIVSRIVERRAASAAGWDSTDPAAVTGLYNGVTGATTNNPIGIDQILRNFGAGVELGRMHKILASPGAQSDNLVGACAWFIGQMGGNQEGEVQLHGSDKVATMLAALNAGEAVLSNARFAALKAAVQTPETWAQLDALGQVLEGEVSDALSQIGA